MKNLKTETTVHVFLEQIEKTKEGNQNLKMISTSKEKKKNSKFKTEKKEKPQHNE